MDARAEVGAAADLKGVAASESGDSDNASGSIRPGRSPPRCDGREGAKIGAMSFILEKCFALSASPSAQLKPAIETSKVIKEPDAVL